MTYKSISFFNTESDLRSAKSVRIRRGLFTKILRIFTLLILDIAALVIAHNLAIFYGTSFVSPWVQSSSFLFLTVVVEISIIASQGLYKEGPNRRNYLSLIKAVSLSELFLLLIAFLYEPSYYVSRSTFILFWCLSIALTSSNRLIFDVFTKLLRSKGAIRYPIFIITDTEEKESHIKLIEKEKCYIIEGISESKCLDWENREGTLKYLRDKGVTEVFVSWNAIKNRLYVCWKFSTAGITLRILPTKNELCHSKSLFRMIGEGPCMTIPVPIIIGSDFWIKRCFDICTSAILLFILSPVYLVIAISIKLDSPGPILFKQNRIGLHCQQFKIWKFRTMVSNAEQLQASLENKNENKDGVLFKLKDDPRITKVGKFLRRYSLDELPQLFNILIGEMSLVGPRPLPTRDVDRFKSAYFIRQEVLPGITGQWQVSGRSNIDNFEDAIKLDLEYIESWSLWLDIQILLKTVQVVLQKTGAY
ncbi:sugar transferase [Calothrix rhizosoleniae]|uniref:sugar transferase n=1 Tax=Calothrix rhizosoleniae TaxID=888997 RepID=UPI000B497DDE|nr:sugar transferase [Calothrix rhizosoleniae]